MMDPSTSRRYYAATHFLLGLTAPIVERLREWSKKLQLHEKHDGSDCLNDIRNNSGRQRFDNQLRHIFDSIPALIHTTRPDGYIDYFNQHWLAYVGRSLEDLQGWKWTASVHPSDVDGIVERWCASLASGEPFLHEARVRRADGQYRWMLHHKIALHDERGQIVKWYGSSIDIEDRKHAEEDLRKSEERWRAVFENSAVGIAVTDVRGRFLATNAAFQRMLGYDRGELEGRSFLDMTHEEDRERNWMLVTELLEGNREQFQIEKRYWRKDGALIWVRNSVSLVPSSDGTPQAIMAIVENITERKYAGEVLREGEARFRWMADAIPEVIWFTALEPEKVLYVSPSFERIWGLPVEDLYRNPRLWTETILPEDRDRVSKAFGRWIAGEDPDYQGIEYRIMQPNGAIRWIHERGVLRLDDHGKPSLASGISTDITERKRADEELRRAEETMRKTHTELAHVARVATMGEMTASIAHEINQPLGAIINNAGASLRWLAAQNMDEVRQSIEHVIKDGHRASDIISRIRALVRKAPPQKDWLDINETIGDVLSLTRTELDAHRVTLEKRFSVDAPTVMADRIQLQQVLLNIIMNAIEAMGGEGEGSRQLVIESKKDKARYVVITVQDSGPGIEPAHLDRLFDAFYSTKPRGLGMGLAISRSIIEAHGGRLWAGANEPRGARFHFTLPIESERTV